MLNPTTENIWYVFTAAGDEAITAHIAALCKANGNYRTQYLDGRKEPDVEEALPFPHAGRVLETIRRIREQRADLWQQGNTQSQPVQDAMAGVWDAGDQILKGWTDYKKAVTALGEAIEGENQVMGA